MFRDGPASLWYKGAVTIWSADVAEPCCDDLNDDNLPDAAGVLLDASCQPLPDSGLADDMHHAIEPRSRHPLAGQEQEQRVAHAACPLVDQIEERIWPGLDYNSPPIHSSSNDHEQPPGDTPPAPRELAPIEGETGQALSPHSRWADGSESAGSDGVKDLSPTAAPSLPAPLSRAALVAVKEQLAAYTGPVARLLVDRYADQALCLTSLAALLVPHIPCDAGRRQFSSALEALAVDIEHRSGGDKSSVDGEASDEDGSPSATKAEPRNALTPELVNGAAAELAVYLGPIAQVIARREAVSAIDPHTLLVRLAAAIPRVEDRVAFLRACSVHAD